MNTSLFSKTPTVTVLDNRLLIVRTLQYHRHPDSPDITDERITYHQYDAHSFLAQNADPRLHASGRSNFTYQPDLAGSVLCVDSADAGTTVQLNDIAGRPLLAINACRVTRTWQYEEATLPGRPLSISEQVDGEATRITERFVYAGNGDAETALNLAGQCVSQYDPAGRMQTDSMALTGVPLSVTRCLLKEADNPDTLVDWQGEDTSAWNDMLAAEMFTTLTTSDAAGAVLTTTDAKGNLQRVAYDVVGLLSGSWLTVKGGNEQIIVQSLTYSAVGQKLREVHGNGVVTTYTYEPQTQRLVGMKTERPVGHAAGAKVLQDLRYTHDPVGNVLSVLNDAEETRFWRNQKVVPENTYAYDTLYQLVSTTGREIANARQQGHSLPTATIPLSTDNSAYTNYTRAYHYDSAGNLTQIRHSALGTNNNFTTDITVSDHSNRGVLSSLTAIPSEVDALFTAGGQQKQLQPGQKLVWTPRNELLTVTPVVREGNTDDRESYRYDAGSQRILKVSKQKAGNNMQAQRVLYLPGLELRSTKGGDTETENLQVMTMGEAGRAQVRVLHWTAGKPADISNDSIRYSYDNLTGSCCLELDGDGKVISMEEYYPYGGTAVWAARSAVEAGFKTIRYSGKERDATGLYYYGYRYYQPWAGRWLSADPAGTMDGLNLYTMVHGNPVRFVDTQGLFGMDRVCTAGASAAREGSSAILASAVQYATVQGIGALNLPNIALTAGGAVVGAVAGAVAGYGTGNWAQSNCSTSSLSMKIGGAVVGAVVGAAPSIVGHFTSLGVNSAAITQIANGLGTVYREISAQHVSHIGSRNPSDRFPDAATAATSFTTAGGVGAAFGAVGGVLLAGVPGELGVALESIGVGSAATAANGASGALVRDLVGNAAIQPPIGGDATFNPHKAVTGMSTRHLALSAAQLVNQGVAAIPGFGEWGIVVQNSVKRAINSSVGDPRTIFSTAVTTGLSAELGENIWDIEMGTTGPGIAQEDVPISGSPIADPAATEIFYMASETTSRQRSYSLSNLRY